MAVSMMQAEQDPAIIWDIFNAYQRTAALRAGDELDLFTAIGEGIGSVEELATHCNASVRGVRIICDYLTVIGLLLKEKDRYRLTPTSAAFLDHRSESSMASMIRFINAPKLVAGFANLAETVRRGTTQLPRTGVIEPQLEEWVIFATSMTPLMASAAEFLGEIALGSGPPPRRVLDIAAGHGLFGMAVAQRAPHARVVAVDWVNVLRVTRENVTAAGMLDRFEFLHGDAFAVDFGGGYDVVLLANLLHHFSESDCERLLRKIYSAMNSGGRPLTLEFVPNEDRVTPPISASFSLMMLGLTPAGDAYSMEQHRRMLRAAGFMRTELLQVPRSPEQCELPAIMRAAS
jgi:ubiquinone/menaquinone biosynthesis C-methylase UbiE